MTVTVLNGDCLQLLPSFADDTFDCTIADPPYGETKLAWDKWPSGWPALVRRVLKPTGSMWVFGSQRMFLERIGEFAGFNFAQDLVWEKHNGSGFRNDRFRRVHKLALHFWRADAPWEQVYAAPQYTNDARPRTIRRKAKPPAWQGSRGECLYRSIDGGPLLERSVQYARSEHGRALHPTQKPLAIVEMLLRYACPPGGHVLDLFAGSGTATVAATRAGIRVTSIEADETFCAVIHDRLSNDAPLLTRASLQPVPLLIGDAA